MRFHCNGELSNQKWAIWVCSAVRVLPTLAPRLLTSLKSVVYFGLVTAYGGPGRNWALSWSTKGVTSPHPGTKAKGASGVEAVFARIRVPAGSQNPGQACPNHPRLSGPGWLRLPHARSPCPVSLGRLPGCGRAPPHSLLQHWLTLASMQSWIAGSWLKTGTKLLEGWHKHVVRGGSHCSLSRSS